MKEAKNKLKHLVVTNMYDGTNFTNGDSLSFDLIANLETSISFDLLNKPMHLKIALDFDENANFTVLVKWAEQLISTHKEIYKNPFEIYILPISTDQQ